MNREYLYRVLRGPVLSEKANKSAELDGQMVFKVAKNATKSEIKTAVETLFNTKVKKVRTLLVKGKAKRTRFGLGKCSDWKKAYVHLPDDHDIDFFVGN